MLRNYFVIAWRNLGKSKVYSFINVIGLATGMAIALLISFWVWDELSYDHSYKNHQSIAMVMMNGSYQGEKWTNDVIPMPLGNALRNQYGSDFKYVSLVAGFDTRVLSFGETKIAAAGPWVEPDFPKMFSLKMKFGNQEHLSDPSSLFISESVSKSLFGNNDPIGKTVKVNNELDLKVTGVYEDFASNSSFYESKILMPWKNSSNWFNSNDPQTNWNNHCGALYVQVADHVEIDKTSDKVKLISVPHIDMVREETLLYPLSKLHLNGEFKEGKAVGGRIQFVWLFATIGIFVLILACINFMNLSTARSEKRAKEVGIRKAIGSLRSQLIGQFLSESLVVAFLSLLLSVLFAQLSMPYFNHLADKHISIPWNNSIFWVFIIGFTLFTGLVSGSYPAFYLSAFKPVKVLKGVFRTGRLASIPRKVLVVLQFTVSVSLIIGTIIVFKQIQYAKSRPVGYSREGLIIVGKNTPDLWKNDDAIQAELKQSGAIENIGETNSLPTDISSSNGGFEWEGMQKGKIVTFGTLFVSVDYGKTIGWKVLQGRDFSRQFADSNSVIINEAAAKEIGIADPVGKILNYVGPIFSHGTHTIVGVIKDMVMVSPYKKPNPVLFFNANYQGAMVIRLNSNAPTNVSLKKVEAVFKKYNPTSPFDYRFNDENYARKFSDEEKIGNLAAVFAILAIFISCLGLFGLASFVAEQKTKEIGIRKVLGASVFNVWRLLSKDFLLLVVLSCAIATPIAWHYLDKWLLNYEYRTDISYWIFILSGLGAILITLLTVSFQAIKAGLNNPVKSLRTE